MTLEGLKKLLDALETVYGPDTTVLDDVGRSIEGAVAICGSCHRQLTLGQTDVRCCTYSDGIKVKLVNGAGA